MQHNTSIKALSAALLAVFSSGALAAGFALQNQTGSGNGNAFAGAAAAAEDAGTIFFNPAGIALLPEGTNVSLAATHIERSITFADQGTGGAIPKSGSNGGDAGGGALVPAGYASQTLGGGLSIGVGVSPTYGNRTEYSKDFIGRFSGYFADLKVVNTNPTLSYKANNTWSFGVGLNHGEAEVEFRQKVPGLTHDIVLSGSDDAWGWNAGVMFQPEASTRIGLAYRSGIKYTMQGMMVAKTAGGAIIGRTPISAELETPDNASLAVSHKYGDKLEVLADVTWTGWSSVQTLSAKARGGVACPLGIPGSTCASLPFRFKDTMRYGLGLNYTIASGVKLRGGIAYDETPVRTSADRTMTLPDSDRTWLSVGAKFALGKASSLDVGYSHIFFDDASTERAVTAGGATVQTVRGDFTTKADIYSLQYNLHF